MADDWQDPQRIVEAIEDPRSKPRTGATIIRLRTGRLDINVYPQLLVKQGRMYKPDATKLCSLGPGILADNLEQQVAVELAGALQAQGEPCFVVPAAELVPLSEPDAITSVRLTKAEFQPANATGKVDRCPWGEAIALAMAQVHQETTETKAVTGSILTRRVTGLGGVATATSLATSGGAKRETVTRSTTHIFIEMVFRNPWRRYRIDAQHFDYALLGDQLQPTSAANARTLARWLLHAAPQARTNVDREELMETGKTGLPELSEHQFSDLTHWLINLVHFGKSAEP